MSALTEKQQQAVTVLRDHKTAAATSDGQWMSLVAVADALGTTKRSAGIVLGALERLGLVVRWEPIYRHQPRFIVLGNDDGGTSL